jgi:hypothetical protein
MINIRTRPKRKSEPLTKEEHKALLKYVNSHHTIVDAAFAIGIHRNVLDRVMIAATGSPETIAAIRKKIAA